MKVARVWVEEGGLRPVEEVWPAGEDDWDSNEKANESGKPELAWTEWGYEKETAGFPLVLAEDVTRDIREVWADIPLQLICSAFEAQARGSWNLVQNTGSWVFSAEAKRSMFGFPISALGGEGITEKGRN